MKMTFKEIARLTVRGYKIWWDINPLIFISTIVYTIISGITPYVGIYISALIINEISGARDPQILTRLALTALISAALLALLNAVLGRWKNYCNACSWYNLNKVYSEKLLSMDFRSVDDAHTHQLLAQIEQNSNWGNFGLTKVRQDFEALIKPIVAISGAVALTVTLFIHRVPEGSGWLTTLNNPFFIAVIILIMFAVTFIAPVLSNKANAYWAKRSDEARLGNRFFSFFGFMGFERTRALDIRIYRQDIICNNILANDPGWGPKSIFAKDARGPMGAYNALSAAISHVFTAIVYIYVCLKSWGGAFGVGSVTQYISSITALSQGISAFVEALGDMRINAEFLRTTFEFLDTPNDMYQGSLTVEKRSDRKYEIEFQNVSFKYDAPGDYALRNISLKFNVGERLAVVGMNGSGKTTFIKLLCRLYDPTEGVILLNGIDIRKYDYLEYMSIFSVVFQDFNLFAFGLGQNVAAQMKYDSKRATECLDQAGFGDRLSHMPLGLETCLYKEFDEKGVEISGGEAQKIALARALYKDAAFVIFDEPTAALDPIAEHEIYSKMNDMVGMFWGKTAVFISHRLSSCRFCNDIAVFHEGGLIQRGSHDELVSDINGKYYELWNAQAQYYTETSA